MTPADGGAAARRPGPPPPSRSSGLCCGPGCSTSPPRFAARRAAPGPATARGPWARAYGLLAAGGGPHTVCLIGPGPDFDPQYAMGTGLDEPVIIASVTADGAGQPLRCSSTVMHYP
jgi:hypothetical protein